MKRLGRSRAGFVLVMVLGALAIMTLLLLALLRGATGQVRGAESEAVLAREKMLADSAVAVVVGQIQQASTPTGQAWISQPGLIRTYAGNSRQPTKSYKLYSAAAMTDTSGGLGFIATDIPADWDSTANQNLYIDLNTPQQAPGFLSPLVYPILDPAAFTSVEGVSADAGHQVEMPVMWLYELQDGTLGPAGNGTKANPIVGRIAFWTDDDTCKIDINTAGCGAPWNTPRANSSDDVAWSTTQPAVGEFSRYPGHAAMTSLVPVFGMGADALSPEQILGLTPRYAWGGSEFGAQTTAAGQTITPKIERIYASVDELLFGTQVAGNSQRQANPLTAAQLDQARFVLTAHSEAPETTMLGEPRMAIWPVSDAMNDSTRTTPTDLAIENAATIGASGTDNTRSYFFQRHNAMSATADLDPSTAWGGSNTQLFNELVARGSEIIPAYGTSFLQKYPGAEWTQLMLEVTDFIRGLNAIDPSPAPFVSYAPGDATTQMGRGFIVPLTTTYGTTPLRGLGRCPTLSSITLVVYVCGFGFDDGSTIDFEMNPDDLAGTNWQANFNLNSPGNRWQHVTSELLRAFVVPCTFQPGCAYPEVSDACDLQISGLNTIPVSSGSAMANFGFAATATSPLLGTPLQKLTADRAWGGNEGPITWRAFGDLLATGANQIYPYQYPFAGSNPVPFKLAFLPGTKIQYNAKSKTLSWPSMPNLSVGGGPNLTVLLRDPNGNTLQTFSVPFPNCTVTAPTIHQECDHYDGSTPGSSHTDWATNSAYQVMPSYYMNLKNRLLATQLSRPLMIQPGDVTREVEAGTDLRVIAALPTVPATFFMSHPNYTTYNDNQAQNLRFADGTSALGASGCNQLIKSAAYPDTAASTTGTDESSGASVKISNAWFTNAACSVPTTASASAFVSMLPAQNIYGDWDTGPGFCPDGALIDLPDEGTSLNPATAYFSLAKGQLGAPTRFAPNALVPSPLVFGSLPAGINPLQPAKSEPWRTLLFCPNPAAYFAATPPPADAVTAAMHPGFASPPDYLLLDNFWMPTVEPYALSTCMATSGKINLNDQIVPFTYLHRNTAFHALLQDLRIPAIPVKMANPYKTAGPPIATTLWNPVDEDTTITSLESRFATGDAYLTEAEVCTVPLTPQVPAADLTSGLAGFWNNADGAGRLTGSNLRQLPYAQLYSRLTTRSNSYTVHVHVQVLQKVPGDPHQDVWNEATDVVLGDWRGSYEIERDLDPAAVPPIAATVSNPGGALGPYRFRTVSSRRFAP